MSIILIEIKNEYTSRLLNILAPLIYNGVNSIYIDATKVAHENDILKVFQTCLKAIPKWDSSIIDRETTRILKESNSVEWLEDLIKATLKSHIQVLTYNCNKNSSVLNEYNNVSVQKLIHMIYIETARELWNNPFLLFHRCPPIEQKRNQRDCLGLIKDCIKEALRKLLPYKQILKQYLCDTTFDVNNLEIDNNITDQEINNLKQMFNTDLHQQQENNNTPQPPNQPNQLDQLDQLTQPNQLDQLDQPTQPTQPTQPNPPNHQSEEQKNLTNNNILQSGFDTPKAQESETVRSRILNIINGGQNTIENKYKIDDKIKEALYILNSNTTINDSETSLMSENVLDVFVNSAHNNKSKNNKFLKF
jgi:hypothetical protein